MNSTSCFWSVVLGIFFLPATAFTATKEPPEHLICIKELSKTDADFAVIGEYVGGTGAERIGMQLTTAGTAAFRALVHAGGLPGDGWDGTTRVRMTGARNGGASGETVALAGDGWTATWRKDAVTGTTATGRAFSLARVTRTSPTLNAPPPPGAIPLFDGSAASGPNWGMKLGPKPEFMGENGTTPRAFAGDFVLHLEFRNPHFPGNPAPKRESAFSYQTDARPGQKWGDFIFVVKISQAFANDVLTTSECGAIAGKTLPKVNMCLPPLTWQTYDVDYTAGRVDGGKVTAPRATVRLNGVVIHDDIEAPLPFADRGKKTHVAPAPVHIHTAAHGFGARFRNVWLLPRQAAGDAAAPADPAPGGNPPAPEVISP